jgi:hypothetical protein
VFCHSGSSFGVCFDIAPGGTVDACACLAISVPVVSARAYFEESVVRA